MHRGIAVGVLTLVCLAVVGGTSALADEELPSESTSHEEGAPYVDAGLDQEVTRGDEVLLDGGGTWDDQGDIAHKEWEIEAPDGRTFQPDCGTCWFTSFRVGQVGEYEVTLTVRDEDGNENEDTLYVRVGEVMAADSGDNAPSSGNSGACFMAYKAEGSHGGCSNHGRLLGYVFNDAGHVEGFEFENKGKATRLYSDIEYNKKGNLVVPAGTVTQELDYVWDVASGLEEPNYPRNVDSDAVVEIKRDTNDYAGTGLNPGNSEAEDTIDYAGTGLNPNHSDDDDGSDSCGMCIY